MEHKLKGAVKALKLPEVVSAARALMILPYLKGYKQQH
jgi:hypothetical protein